MGIGIETLFLPHTDLFARSAFSKMFLCSCTCTKQLLKDAQELLFLVSTAGNEWITIDFSNFIIAPSIALCYHPCFKHNTPLILILDLGTRLVLFSHFCHNPDSHTKLFTTLPFAFDINRHPSGKR